MSEYISREELIDRLRKTELSAEQIRMLVYPREVVDRAIYDCSPADVRENIHGQWERMSDLPEDKDDRYKCSQCGNVVHHSNGVNLYHFNSWCGRCGSLNNSLIAGLEPKGEKGET